MSMEQFFSKAGNFHYHMVVGTVVRFYYDKGESELSGSCVSGYKWKYHLIEE